MASRKQHPNKTIEEAVQYAEQRGWCYQKAGKSAHCWGRILCLAGSRDGCMISVWSTPRNGYNHAKQIRKRVDACSH